MSRLIVRCEEVRIPNAYPFCHARVECEGVLDFQELLYQIHGQMDWRAYSRFIQEHPPFNPQDVSVFEDPENKDFRYTCVYLNRPIDEPGMYESLVFNEDTTRMLPELQACYYDDDTSNRQPLGKHVWFEELPEKLQNLIARG